jgi:hypothetical protein
MPAKSQTIRRAFVSACGNYVIRIFYFRGQGRVILRCESKKNNPPFTSQPSLATFRQVVETTIAEVVRKEETIEDALLSISFRRGRNKSIDITFCLPDLLDFLNEIDGSVVYRENLH